MKATAGRFTVEMNEAGSAEILGPEDYMNSDAYRRFMDRIGSNPVIIGAPSSIPIVQLIAVALQTDYAAFAGMKQFCAANKIA